MLDKKTNEAVDTLIKKIKENNLGSIKISNKTNTIEISNNSLNHSNNQNTQSVSSINNQNIKNDNNDNFISISSFI